MPYEYDKPVPLGWAAFREENPDDVSSATVHDSSPQRGRQTESSSTLQFNFGTSKVVYEIESDPGSLNTLRTATSGEDLTEAKIKRLLRLLTTRSAQFMRQQGVQHRKWRLQVLPEEQRRSSSSSQQAKTEGCYDVLAPLKLKKEKPVVVKTKLPDFKYVDRWSRLILPKPMPGKDDQVALRWRWGIHSASAFRVRSRKSIEDESRDFDSAAPRGRWLKLGGDRFSKSSIRVVFSLS
ncbi:hypothetical protein JCM3765_007708 [Sporobolomyces pararoseus]